MLLASLAILFLIALRLSLLDLPLARAVERRGWLLFAPDIGIVPIFLVVPPARGAGVLWPVRRLALAGYAGLPLDSARWLTGDSSPRV